MTVAATLAELLALPAVQRSLVGLVLAGTFLPLVGVLIIGLDVLTVRFAVMHVALLGIALGLVFGFDPLLGALVLCVLCGAGLAPLADRPGGLSGPMGFLMTLTIAAALLVLSISGVNANGAFALLWGSILGTRPIDLVLLAGAAIAVLAWFARARPSVGLVLADREVAACSGVAVRATTAVVLVVIAASIALSIRLTGALLVDALTILPALAARNLADSLGPMVAWAIGLGLACNLVGFVVALVVDGPPGPVLVLVAGSVTLITYLLGRRTLHVPSH